MDKSKEKKEEFLMCETWDDVAEFHHKYNKRPTKNMDSLLFGLEIELLKLGVIHEIRKNRPINKGLVSSAKRFKARKKR